MILLRRSAMIPLALALGLASMPSIAAKQASVAARATSAGDWTYVRDPNGNITKTIAPNGRVSTTTFDALNRPQVTTYEGAGPGEVSKVTRHHDGNGNVTAIDEVRDGVTRTETRKYDHFDRLEHVTDVHGRTLDYTYDAVGNRTHMRDRDGQTTVWTYDALNCNTGITVPGQGTTSQTCYPSGKLKAITHPDGSTSTTTYDDAGRIETLIHAKAGQTLASYRYRYDPRGNRIEQKEINGAGEQVTEYRYDEADRLTQVIEPDRTTVYTLDPVGNRVEEKVTDANGVVISDSILTYNERDQLTARDDPTTGTHVDQTYDPNGNLKTQQVGGVLRTYSYDGQDRLVELVLPNQPPLRFDYNPRGQRIEKAQGGQETRYQYDDQSLTAETNHIGNTLKRYHYSAQQLLSETLAGSTPVNRQFLLDALKTPIAVLTQTGAISARTRYDAWGRIVSQTNDTGSTVTPNRDAPISALPSTDAQPFGFTGYVKDGESGLYYANARYYDPATARFTTEDQEAGKDLTPPSLHRYLYAYANPTVYIDPTGRCGMATFDTTECIYSASIANEWSAERRSEELAIQYEAERRTALPRAAAISTALSGGVLGPWTTAGLLTIGGGSDVAQQMSVEGKAYYEVDYGRSATTAGFTAGGGVILGPTIGAASPWVSVPAKTAVYGLAAYGAVEAGKDIGEGSAQGNPARLILGTGKALFSLAGALATVSNVPRVVVESPKSTIAVTDNPTQTNRGVHYVLENSSKPPLAQAYEDAIPGTSYDIETQKRLTPALKFTNPNPRGRPEVRFDGVDLDNPNILVDRKLNVTTRSKQISDVQRWAEALRQNLDYSVRVEVPSQVAYKNMIRLLNKAGVESAPIDVQVKDP